MVESVGNKKRDGPAGGELGRKPGQKPLVIDHWKFVICHSWESGRWPYINEELLVNGHWTLINVNCSCALGSSFLGLIFGFWFWVFKVLGFLPFTEFKTVKAEAQRLK